MYITDGLAIGSGISFFSANHSLICPSNHYGYQSSAFSQARSAETDSSLGPACRPRDLQRLVVAHQQNPFISNTLSCAESTYTLGTAFFGVPATC